ncbi:MAG: hypothetical protein NTZ46_10915 [Verrucomicrobia bacterium]|nr:hypothetical protein [Verrucomicrobiota bacterium]
MKRIFVFSLLSCTLLVACAPQRSQPAYVAPFGYPSEALVAPGPDTVPPEVAPGTAVETVPTPPPAAPTPSPTPLPRQRTAAYGIPEPGKPGFMRSPHNPSAGLIDYRGMPPGTEVKDFYSPGKTILVP